MESKPSNSSTKLGPGKLYIFNHKYFDIKGLSVRDGTEYDVQALQDNFAIFNVETILYNDLKFEELSEQIKKISTINFSNHSCIVIAILTHGFENNVLAARDEIYSFNKIVLTICTNRYLKYKPKIFLLQACRGDIDLRNRVLNFKTDGPALATAKADPSVLKYYYHEEKYILHSTSDEFVSYREDKVGSAFIQTFCLYLKLFGFHRPINEIFSLVMIAVQKLTGYNQMPEITTNATMPYVFGAYTQKFESSVTPISETISDESTRREGIPESTESADPFESDNSISTKIERIKGSLQYYINRENIDRLAFKFGLPFNLI